MSRVGIGCQPVCQRALLSRYVHTFLVKQHIALNINPSCDLSHPLLWCSYRLGTRTRQNPSPLFVSPPRIFPTTLNYDSHSIISRVGIQDCSFMCMKWLKRQVYIRNLCLKTISSCQKVKHGSSLFILFHSFLFFFFY